MKAVLIKNYTESSQVIFILTALNHTEGYGIPWCAHFYHNVQSSCSFSHRPIKKLKSDVGRNSCTFFFS